MGPTEDAVDQLLRGLTLGADRLPLAALALSLARSIDQGAGLALAGISKELRATLGALVPEKGPSDPFLDRLQAPLELSSD